MEAAAGENRSHREGIPIATGALGRHFSLSLSFPSPGQGGNSKNHVWGFPNYEPGNTSQAKPLCKGEEALLGEEWAGLGSVEEQRMWQWPRVIMMMKVMIKNHNNKPLSNSQRAFSLSPGIWNLPGLV